jgi:hypothetical protein|nr:MAG TPA: hypothetical protein [Caudoviricetes sp.]
MSIKELGGSFWIVRNLGFERIVKLRGLYWIGGNLEGRFRLSETLDFDALRNFGVQIRACGNLAFMHMRNLECAIVVFAKLRGAFSLCGCGVCVGCLFFLFNVFNLFGIRAFWGLLSGQRNSKKGII